MIWFLWVYLAVFAILAFIVPRKAYNSKHAYDPMDAAVGAFFGCMFWPAYCVFGAVVCVGFALLWVLIPEFRKDCRKV